MSATMSASISEEEPRSDLEPTTDVGTNWPSEEHEYPEPAGEEIAVLAPQFPQTGSRIYR